MTLKTLLTTDPYAVGFAAPLAKRNDSALAKLINSRETGLTMPRPVSPSAAGLLALIDPKELPAIFNSGLAGPLSSALKSGDSAELVILATAFVAAGWITPDEFGAVAKYLQSTTETPCSAAEKAGIVAFGGSVSVNAVSDALNAKE